MAMFYAALAAAILLGVAGQMLLKGGAQAHGWFEQLFTPQTIFGLALYVCSALFYIVALRKIPVSVAFPSVSLSYALVALLGYYFWSEPMGLGQIAGIALICSGVLLLYHT
jgi:small multidrug resistance pump